MRRDHVALAAYQSYVRYCQRLYYTGRNPQCLKYARQTLESSLWIAKVKIGEGEPQVALLLCSMGEVLASAGEFDKAIPYFHRAIELRQTRFGPDDATLGWMQLKLGRAYLFVRKPAEGAEAYRRSLKILQRRLPQQAFHAEIGLGSMLYVQGKHREALDHYDRGLRGLHYMVSRVLPTLSDAAYGDHLEESVKYLLTAMHCILEQSNDRAFVDRSAEWIINLKALEGDAAGRRALMARNLTDPATAEIARALRHVHDQIATFAVGDGSFANAGPSMQRVQRLWEEERRLAAALGEKARRRMVSDHWVALDEVRRRLDDDTVLIEIARTRPHDMKTLALGPPHYHAWVIPPAEKGDVKLVDLGRAFAMEDQMRKFAWSVSQDHRRFPDARRRGIQQGLQEDAKALGGRILGPLQPHIDPYQRWLISPDYMLWMMPWAAMRLTDGKYAIEDHEVCCLLTGRDLTATESRVAASPPMIVADPDFDLGLPPEKSGNGPAIPLPQTAEMARAIRPMIANYTRMTPILCTGKEALERTVKSAKSPQILVLNTHSYFTKAKDFRRRGTNPFLRCGLTLAGANVSSADIDPAGDDGMLTGLEVVGMDLRGTELVVLGACKTAQGDMLPYQGVRGIRHAFHLAGAEAVMAALWSVPVEGTSVLIENFFTELNAGRSAPAALRHAQLSMIRGQTDLSQPYHWAAFTITRRAF